MANTVAIIQARMGSTRLPGKVLMDLGGRPLLAWTVRAAASAPGVDAAVVATSDTADDDAVARWCRDAGVACTRGPAEDVLARYALAAATAEADTVVRLTADCPFVDPAVIGQLVRLFEATGAAVACNTRPPTWPDGLGCHVIARHALDAANREVRRPVEREHVVPYLLAHRQRFPLATMPCPVLGLADERWTVDYAADLDFVRAVAARLPVDRPPAWIEVLRVLDAEPSLRTIHAAAVRDEGSLRSLAAEALPDNRRLARSRKLWRDRAAAMPGALPEETGPYPVFLSHGEGGRVWDVDGNEYVDMIAGAHGLLLGHHDPDVDAAVRTAGIHAAGAVRPSPLEVRVARHLARLFPCAGKLRFVGDPAQALEHALLAARRATGREAVLAAAPAGFDRAGFGGGVAVAPWPDAVRHAERAKDLAAVLVGFAGADFATGDDVRNLAAAARGRGALVIFDEASSAFRLAPGGAQSLFGTVPDLAVLGRSIANGFPLAATVGRGELLDAVEPLPATGGHADTGPLAAALATLPRAGSRETVRALARRGARLADGIGAAIERHGIGDAVSVTGAPACPVLVFRDTAAKPRVLADLRRTGVLSDGVFAPCLAHTDVDLGQVAAACDAAFARLARRGPGGG